MWKSGALTSLAPYSTEQQTGLFLFSAKILFLKDELFTKLHLHKAQNYDFVIAIWFV